MDSTHASGNIKCPKCGQLGYLNLREEKYLRMTHNYHSGTEHCHLGTPKKALAKLQRLSSIDPELVMPVLIQKIESYVTTDIQKIKENPEILELIQEIQNLAKNFDAERHKNRYREKCPHCGKEIAVYVQRVGSQKRYYVENLYVTKYKLY